MASLNTLRTKGGWIISIVIGIALLAFILPEVFSRSGGMSPDKIKVGEIDGEKVSYTEYLNRSDYFNAVIGAMYGRSNFSAEETAQIQDMAWGDLINEYAFDPGYEKLGLRPLAAEQTDMVTGTYISPVIQREFTNPQTGMYDRSLLATFVGQLDLNPNGAMMWEYLKDQMVDQRVLVKYMTLVSAGLNLTDMEVQSQYEADNKTVSAKIVAQNYNDVPDSLVSVSNVEITKYYDDHKQMFRRNASRDIEYVVFYVLPSEDDYAEAKKSVDQLASEFSASTTPVQYAALNTQSPQDNTFKKESEIPVEIAAAIWDKPEAMYGPILSNDVYTMARLGEVKMMPDSLGARHILLAPMSTNIADSLVNLLQGGADFAEVAGQFSVDPSGKQNSGDLGRFTPETMIPEFSNALLSHKTGDVFTVTTQWGLHIVEKTYQSTPVKKAQIAMIDYHVDPSSATEMEVLNRIRDFQQSAAGSYDNFRKATSENALSPRIARIQNTDRNVSGLPESRELVRWAFSHEKGEVSDDIKIGNDSYVVAALTSASEDGIAPMEEFRDEIRMVLTRQKKGEFMASKMTGNTIEEVAASLGKEVVTADNIRFTGFSVTGVGSDSKLVGALTSGIAEGTLSKPVVGDNGVYRFVVTAATQGEVTKETERVMLESQSEMYMDQRLMQALNTVANIKDFRVRYF